MPHFVVLRRAFAATAADLDAALTRLRAFDAGPAARSARWRESCALRERDGRFGLACVFDADEDAPPQTVFELHSHVVHESDGRFGSLCLLQALDRASLAQHDRRAALPADEVIAVPGRIVVRRDDPPTAVPQR